MKGIIALLSGGLDSAVAAVSVRDSISVALSFDYGQRHLKELLAANELCQYYGWYHEILEIKIPAWSALTHGADLKVGGVSFTPQTAYPTTFVPGRNLIFLAYAASLAYQKDAVAIVGGWNQIDYSGYPDCRRGFLQNAEHAISGALGRSIMVLSPLMHLVKGEIILKGINLKVPFEMTWSCYKGESTPCGVCDSCKFRAKGFEEAGIQDPLIKED